MSAEDWRTLMAGVTLMITALTPILLALIARRQTKAADKVELVRTDLATSTSKQTVEIQAIHKAVNSERAEMQRKLDVALLQIQVLTKGIEAGKGNQ